MPIELQTTLISALVALLVGGTGTALSFNRLRRERTQWLIDFKSDYSMELYRKRLETYPEVLAVIGELSGRNMPVPPLTVRRVAGRLNEWFYSVGGLTASTRTRGALLGLRENCDKWANSGERPNEFFDWRNVALALLRHDLDLRGLETFDFDDPSSLLQDLQRDIREMDRQGQAKQGERSLYYDWKSEPPQEPR